MSYLIIPGEDMDIGEVTSKTASFVDNILSSSFGKERIKTEAPGDVLIDGRKICGILTEALIETESSFCRYLMTGIGLRPLEGVNRAKFVADIIKKMDEEFKSLNL